MNRSNPIREGFLLFVGNALHSIQPLQFSHASDDGTAFYKSLVDNLYDGVYFVDLNRTITYWNHGAERLTGYSASEVVGHSCFDNFLMHVDEKGCGLCKQGCPLQRTISDGQSREAEVYLRHKLGHRVPVSVRAAPIRDNHGRITGAVEVFTDITAKKVVERRAGELEGIAYLDSLTGTYNRRLMELKVHQALEEVQQFGRGMGLLMLDVDDFKQVNDTWGHEAGDLALQAVARTLQRCFRPTDIVGRWGGEEFLVLVVNTQANIVQLTKIAERCRMLVANNGVTLSSKLSSKSDSKSDSKLSSHPSSGPSNDLSREPSSDLSKEMSREMPSENLRVTASVGATALLSCDTSQSALRRVDELLYRSKSAGRNKSTVA